MPRSARLVATDLPHHVIMRGNNRRHVFHDDADQLKYLSLLAQVKKKFGFKLYHYVLMGNHVHLLIEVAARNELAAVMQGINQRYSLWYKKKYGFVGHLWQGRYASFIIDTDAYLLTCGIYIELNPVRAGIVERPEDYPWSSYHAYAFDKDEPLIDDNPLMPKTKERSGIYRELTEEWRRLKLST